MSTVEQPAPVVLAEPRAEDTPSPRRRDWPNVGVVAVAAALACSPLEFGYYDLTAWAPLGLGAATLLVMLLLGPRSRPNAMAMTATAGMTMLVALSFASLLWAESRSSAWTSANRLGFYAVVLAIGLIAIRTRITAWATMLILGLPALVTALVLAAQFVIAGGADAFLHGRLNAPIGYANGTAALLVMGAWPWVGLAERATSRWWHAAAVSTAALIASLAVLTQTRAILLAATASIALTMLRGPGRIRRGRTLLIVLAAVALSAHWTLRVYTSTGPTHLPRPDTATLRGAGLALLGAAAVAFVLAALAERAVARQRPAVSARTRSRVVLVVLALCALGLTAGAVVGRRTILAQWHDFTTLNDERPANDRFVALGGGPRYDLWRIALGEFAGDPLGGVGAGNYADQEFRRRRGLEHVTNPHSLELQMLAELGPAGMIGLLLLVVPVLIAGLRGYSRCRSRADTALTTAALGMFTAWLAGTSVDWLYDIPGLTGMALLAAAVVLTTAAPSLRASEARSSPFPRTRPVLGLALGLGLTLGVVALFAGSLGRQYLGTLYSDSGRGLVYRHPLPALQTLRTAERLDPWSMQTQYAVAAAYARLDDYQAARAALRHAEQLEPENYVPPALLGDIATRAGRPAEALTAYLRALRLDPLEPALQQAVARTRARLR